MSFFGSEQKQEEGMERSVEGRDVCGNFACHVKFNFLENGLRGMITDIFFYV